MREKWESMLEKLESTEGIQECTGDWMLHSLGRLVSMKETWENILEKTESMRDLLVNTVEKRGSRRER